MPRVPSALTTSQIFCDSNNPGAKSSRPSGSKIPNSTNWPPIHSHWPNMTLSSFVPERNPVTPLHTKLNQLSLTTMSHQLDQTISDATGRNLSFPQTLEALADLELEARNARSIERRFRLSRLQAQHSIDSFNFKHHKSRAELKTRILRLLDLDFLQKGTSAIFIGNPDPATL